MKKDLLMDRDKNTDVEKEEQRARDVKEMTIEREKKIVTR